MSSTKTIRKAIVAQLATIDGTGDFTFDLSKPKQVLSGKYSRPPGAASAPFACVYTVEVTEEAAATLTDKGERGIFQVIAWARKYAKDPEDRQDGAEDLLDDVRRALRANPRLSGNVLTMSVSAIAFEDELDQTPDKSSWGVCCASVSVTWRER